MTSESKDLQKDDKTEVTAATNNEKATQEQQQQKSVVANREDDGMKKETEPMEDMRNSKETSASPSDQQKNDNQCSEKQNESTKSATAVQEEEKPMSKNQLKKRRRYEKAMDIKKRKKMQEKATKRAKAIAEGRDLDEERRLQEERTKSGEGHARREQYWKNKMKSADTTFKVCLDCAWEDEMIPKEINSLALQIRYCYAGNKRSQNPVYLSVSSLQSNGKTMEHLAKIAGFPDQWYARNFSCSDQSLVQMHPKREQIVYLTSDSENVLETLDDSKIYVIGGIVDRNRLVRAAADRAESFGITTAKLPITQYLHLFTTKVLTCNHVFEILLKFKETNDWKKAMLAVLPHRK
eukprot:CAMPEP_0195297866 /NCGR_PEP_ID=MMETSP0707-20130614/22258_1 /TAXON_ID=33640 /ORGANISM="Asterionellopsis glacialis, Strain CCMP134" /LENGTH=350 /DNA_ID=CAMNT_0040359777 /DNA_START=147 /DNA_END=1196 /DNA_ORIENTATION=-